MRIVNGSGLPEGDTDAPVRIVSPRDGIPKVVSTREGLRAVRHALRQVSTPVAIDVERAQGFRYGADPYLLQIRREGAGTFLLDTHELSDLSSLVDVLDAPWILHAADQDLPNLRQLGMAPPEIFDTEVAARLLGFERFGLASVCEQVLGLSLAKDHQAANWSVRPLPTDWLRYAALDVELLTELYRCLGKMLHERGRWEWAEQEFSYVANMPAPEPKVDKWRSLPGASKITDPRQRAVLRALWQAREEIGRELDLAPGRLVRNSALVRAAQQPPRNRRALQAIAEFRSPIARQHSTAWLRAINSALTLDAADLPKPKAPLKPGEIPEARFWARLDPEAHARLSAVRAAVGGVAAALGLAPDVVLSPKVQRYLSWAPLETRRPVSDAVESRLAESDARPWQRDLVTAPVAQALTQR